MAISSKGRYALRMLVDLAQQEGEEYVSLQSISERQNISKKYLEQIATLLTKSHLLSVARGKQGGYQLTKAPEEISVADVLSATEGTMASAPCTIAQQGECNSCGEDCSVYPVWRNLDSMVQDYLGGISIRDLMNSKNGTAGI